VRINPLTTIAFLCWLLVSMFIIQSGYASSGWTQIYEGDGYDSLFPYSVIQTSDGGYAMAVFADTKHVVESPSWRLEEQYQLWLIKTDSSGSIQWKQIYGITYPLASDRTYSLVQANDGGYTIGGNTAGPEWWLIKTDASGIMQWNKTYTYSQDPDVYDYFSLANSMIKTKDGGYALAGSATVRSSGGSREFCLLKVDSAGNVQWKKTFNSDAASGETYNREDEAYSVVQTMDEGYALAGQSIGSNVADFWLIKTDSSGKEQWNKKYAEPYLAGGAHFLEVTHKVIQTSDGGYALASSLEKAYEDDDFYLTKVDSSGNVQWQKSYGAKYIDVPCSVVQLNDGGFALGGTMTEVGTAGPISKDLAIVRTDSSGNIQWTKVYNAKINATLDTKSEDFTYSMIRTKDGAYVIAGTTVNAWDGSHIDVFLVKTETLETPFEASSPLSLGNVTGQIEMQAPGQNNWTPATKGTSLSAGTMIKTNQESGEFTLGETTTLQLAPNTLVEIQTSTGNSQKLKILQGEITGTVKNLPAGSTLEVEMSQAVATIKGTVFTVTENGAESKLSVEEGIVEFTSKTNGNSVEVMAGQTVTATANGLGNIVQGSGFSFVNTAVIILAISVAAIAGIAVWIVKRKKNKT
jgi:hypothetical protein